MKKLLLIALFLVGISANAQLWEEGIVTGPMTTSEINAIVSPTEGRQVYNSDTTSIWLFDGTQWNNTSVGTGGTYTAGDGLSLTGTEFSVTNPFIPGNYVPYNGATTIVNLGTNQLTVGAINASNNVETSQAVVASLMKLNPQSSTPQVENGKFYMDNSGNTYLGVNSTWHRIYTTNDALSGGTDDQNASEVAITDMADNFTATDVEGALAELANGSSNNGFGIVAEGVLTTDGSNATYTITHNLGYAPVNTRIQIQSLNNSSGSILLNPSISNITSTTFDIFLSSTVRDYAWRIFGTGTVTGQTADEVAFTPYGTIAATNTQDAIEELLDESGSISSVYSTSTDIASINETGIILNSIQTTNNRGFISNEYGEADDFRVESDTDENLIFGNGTTNRVGIGTNAPTTKLDVNGTINATALTVNGTPVSVGASASGFHSNVELTTNATLAYSNQVTGSGYRVDNLLKSGTDLVLTLDNLRSEQNENYKINSLGGVATIVPESGVTLLGLNQGGNNAISIPAFGDVSIFETDVDGTFKVSGAYTWVTSSTSNLYPYTDVANPTEGTGVNAAWVGSSIETLQASTFAASSGTSSIEVIDTGASNFGVVVMQVTGLTAATVNASLDVRQAVGTTGRVEIRNLSGGTQSFEITDNSSTFDTISVSGILTGTVLEIAVYARYGSDETNRTFIDNVNITQ